MTKLLRFSRFLILIPLIFLAFSSPTRAQTIVCLQTTLSEICMELLETEAPVTSQNFLAYVNQGSYRNSFFHFSQTEQPVYAQTGRYADTGRGTLDGILEIFRRPAISRENSISNTRGTVAAIADDPENPDTITSQFLINLTDNPELDGEAVVFARILESDQEAIDAIAFLPVITLDNDGLSQVPVAGQEVPIFNSPRIMIFEAEVFDGDPDDLEPGDGDAGDGSGDGDSGDGSGDGAGDGAGDGDGDTDNGETPTPGEGETLYEDAVCVDTNVGEFCMELFPEIAPITVENFLNYVNNGQYDNTIIHRSVPNFVIQGGGYTASSLGASIDKGDAIENEFSLSNLRGTVAMARIGGLVNSATSEWFVNLVNNTQLDTVDGGFTVFAQIITGLDVVDSIAGLPRSNQQSNLGNAFGELPLTDLDDDGVDADDLVVVNRVYVSDVIASDSDNGDGGADNPAEETTATYSTLTSSMFVPVWINGELYRVIMFRDFDASSLSFTVDTTRIVSLTDIGQDTATMDLDSGILTIPSIAVGSLVVNNVEMELTDFATLTFRVTGYQRAD